MSAGTPRERDGSTSEEPVAHPGVHVPPPFLFAVPFAVGLLIQKFAPTRVYPEAMRPMMEIAGVALMAGWFVLASGAVWLFFRRRTTIIPNRPSRALVTSGPYRFTRNPMYLSLSALYLGGAIVLNMLWPLVFLPIAVGLVHTLVIPREERYLAAAFGDEYEAYRRRVKRWLGWTSTR
jgi:protein-S-isoprenylcysteine O-methyltransferase Ste14